MKINLEFLIQKIQFFNFKWPLISNNCMIGTQSNTSFTSLMMLVDTKIQQFHTSNILVFSDTKVIIKK